MRKQLTFQDQSLINCWTFIKERYQVGQIQAENLLSYCGTLEGIEYNAKQGRLAARIPGVGKGTEKKILTVIKQGRQ